MTTLKELKIKHYRGFFDEQSITFAAPNKENDRCGLTIIMGPNNMGKTSIIEALLLKDDGNKKFTEAERHPDQSPIISIETSDGNTCTYTNINSGSQIKKEGNHNIKFEVIQSRRHWQYYSANVINPENFAEQSSQASVRNSGGIDTVANLKDIHKDQVRKSKLDNLMKELIPHFSDWTIDTNEQGDYVKYIAAESKHQASFLGDGIISLFRICAHLINETGNRVLIIDEPELSLHPSAQKNLSRLLSKASFSKQIVLCTHSPYFVNWEDFLKGAKFVRLNKPNDKKCEVSILCNAKKYGEYIGDNLLEWQKPQMLDTVSKEILFAEKILFVEGQEDVGLIKKWLTENNKTQNFDIYGYGVAGYSNMRVFLEMAKDLGIHKVAALYDSGVDADKYFENDKEIFTAKDNDLFLDYFFSKLPTEDIRDKVGKLCEECKKILCKKCNKTIKADKEGIFNESGALNDKYKNEFEQIMNNILSYFND